MKKLLSSLSFRKGSKTILKDIAVSVVLLVLASAFAFLFFDIVPGHVANIALIYILALVLISRYTQGYFYGIIASVISVVSFNYLFTHPYFELNFLLTGYPITFLLMLAISVLTSAMTSHMSIQAAIISEREKLLAEAEKEKMRANLLRAVSHDLRTPLTSMIGNSASYLENETKLSPETKSDIVRSIYNDSNWLLNMVENLLTVTRIQGENLRINTSLESVEEVVSEALMRINKRFPNQTVHATVPDEMLLIPMDAILIEQVIINLLENAFVHSGSREPIELKVESAESSICFSITDHGHGIPDYKMENLFESTFYDPKENVDSYKGMGIGLSICKTIINAHHGTIHARNLESGAEFCFFLPKEVKSESIR